MKTDCKKCNGKGWFFVDEWFGVLQGRKDCDCQKPLKKLTSVIPIADKNNTVA